MEMLKSSAFKFAAIIPARSGSKSIKDKNLALLGGHPLIAYSIALAKMTEGIDKVIVSTDSKKIAKVALDYGAEVPFLRPKKLSMGNVNLRTVQKFSLSELERNKIFPDLIIHLEETYPFRDKDLIDQAIKI